MADSSSVPGMFARLYTAPPENVLWDMYENDTSFEDAMEKSADVSSLLGYAGVEDDLFDFTDDDIFSAMYQAQVANNQGINPDEVMRTPWGPGLSGEELDDLFDEYPGAKVGLDLDRFEEILEGAEEFLGFAGDDIQEMMDSMADAAESEGRIGTEGTLWQRLGDQLGDILQFSGEAQIPTGVVGSQVTGGASVKDILEEMKKVWEQDAYKKGDVSAWVRELVEKPITYEGIKNVLGKVDITDVILSRQGGVLGGVIPRGPDIEAGQEAGQTDYETELDATLSDNPDVKTLVTYLVDAETLTSLDIEKWMANSPAWATWLSEMELTEKEMGEIPGQLQDAYKEAFQGTRPYQEQGAPVGTKDDLDVRGKLLTELEAETEDLRKKFYTTVYAQPGGGRADVQAQLPGLFQQSKTLFFLGRDLDLWGYQLAMLPEGARQKYEDLYINAGIDVIIPDVTPAKAKNIVEEKYDKFLHDFLTNPDQYRTGENFSSKLDRVNTILQKYEHNPSVETWSTKDQQDYVWINGLFGEDIDGTANRLTLIQMQVTGGGRGYYSRKIHSSIDKLMQHYTNIGWTKTEIFDRMTSILGREDVAKDAGQAEAQSNAGKVTPSGEEDFDNKVNDALQQETNQIIDSAKVEENRQRIEGIVRDTGLLDGTDARTTFEGRLPFEEELGRMLGEEDSELTLPTTLPPTTPPRTTFTPESVDELMGLAGIPPTGPGVTSGLLAGGEAEMWEAQQILDRQRAAAARDALRVTEPQDFSTFSPGTQYQSYRDFAAEQGWSPAQTSAGEVSLGLDPTAHVSREAFTDEDWGLFQDVLPEPFDEEEGRKKELGLPYNQAVLDRFGERILNEKGKEIRGVMFVPTKRYGVTKGLSF